jgi:hypothetical protein
VKNLEQKQAAMRERQAEKLKPKPEVKSTPESHRFKPGVSGNPAGAGPGRPCSPLPLTAGPLVRQKLAEINTEDSRKRQKFAHIIDTLVEIATDPKAPTACTKAAEVLLDRGWGKPIQSIEQTVSFKSREEELKFIKEILGLQDHDHSSGSQSVN